MAEERMNPNSVIVGYKMYLEDYISGKPRGISLATLRCQEKTLSGYLEKPWPRTGDFLVDRLVALFETTLTGSEKTKIWAGDIYQAYYRCKSVIHVHMMLNEKPELINLEMLGWTQKELEDYTSCSALMPNARYKVLEEAFAADSQIDFAYLYAKGMNLVSPFTYRGSLSNLLGIPYCKHHFSDSIYLNRREARLMVTLLKECNPDNMESIAEEIARRLKGDYSGSF